MSLVNAKVWCFFDLGDCKLSDKKNSTKIFCIIIAFLTNWRPPQFFFVLFFCYVRMYTPYMQNSGSEEKGRIPKPTSPQLTLHSIYNRSDITHKHAINQKAEGAYNKMGK